MGIVGKATGQPKPQTKGNETMYWIEDGNGHRRPCANAPRAEITNLQEVFAMLDAGTKPCIAHAEYANGDTMDVQIPSNYARNSIGRKTRIRGNELFIKRLNVDISYLARYEWGRVHQWDEGRLGSWTDAIGVPWDDTPVDPDIVSRLQPVFPQSDITGWLDLYSIRRRWAPVPGTSTLIHALLHEERNMPLEPRRPAKSGIAFETRDTGYGEMGVARDKRTGQTWMWPMGEERDHNMEFGVAPETGGAFVNYRDADGRKRSIKEMVGEIDEENNCLGWNPSWVGPTNRRLEYSMDPHGQNALIRLDRRDIKRALDEELRRGGLPESFDYPCRTVGGRIVWCRWDGLGGQECEHPIVTGDKPDARKVGTLTRRTDKNGLRWWQWTDADGNQGKPLPSYEQAMLDFIDSTDLGLRHY